LIPPSQSITDALLSRHEGSEKEEAGRGVEGKEQPNNNTKSRKQDMGEIGLFEIKFVNLKEENETRKAEMTI
jgi:hypothetical protein